VQRVENEGPTIRYNLQPRLRYMVPSKNGGREGRIKKTACQRTGCMAMAGTPASAGLFTTSYQPVWQLVHAFMLL